MASDYIRMQDLLENPDAHVPVCLCLDTSGSMMATVGGIPTGETTVIDGKLYHVVSGGRTRLETLQKGIQLFYDAVYEDENARYAAEISIVTFDDTARVLRDFSRVEYNDVRESVPILKTSNLTALGAGVNLALDCLEKRKKQYKDKGIDYYQPWLVIMTDGEDNGSPDELDKARMRIQRLVSENKLSVFPFIIGTDAGKATLASLSPAQAPMQIEVTQMKGLFTWMGKSIAAVSSGSIGDNKLFTLTESDIIKWDAPLE
ncbi:MAG: VWA domain-containing protein [Lachnospiraceae bacterium]|jgi:uncharacterized protein YegL